MSWLNLWKGLLLFTLAAYALLVLVVSVGGVKNIKEMFRDLKK